MGKKRKLSEDVEYEECLTKCEKKRCSSKKKKCGDFCKPKSQCYNRRMGIAQTYLSSDLSNTSINENNISLTRNKDDYFPEQRALLPSYSAIKIHKLTEDQKQLLTNRLKAGKERMKTLPPSCLFASRQATSRAIKRALGSIMERAPDALQKLVNPTAQCGVSPITVLEKHSNSTYPKLYIRTLDKNGNGLPVSITAYLKKNPSKRTKQVLQFVKAYNGIIKASKSLFRTKSQSELSLGDQRMSRYLAEKTLKNVWVRRIRTIAKEFGMDPADVTGDDVQKFISTKLEALKSKMEALDEKNPLKKLYARQMDRYESWQNEDTTGFSTADSTTALPANNMALALRSNLYCGNERIKAEPLKRDCDTSERCDNQMFSSMNEETGDFGGVVGVATKSGCKDCDNKNKCCKCKETKKSCECKGGFKYKCSGSSCGGNMNAWSTNDPLLFGAGGVPYSIDPYGQINTSIGLGSSWYDRDTLTMSLGGSSFGTDWTRDIAAFLVKNKVDKTAYAKLFRTSIPFLRKLFMLSTNDWKKIFANDSSIVTDLVSLYTYILSAIMTISYMGQKITAYPKLAAFKKIDYASYVKRFTLETKNVFEKGSSTYGKFNAEMKEKREEMMTAMKDAMENIGGQESEYKQALGKSFNGMSATKFQSVKGYADEWLGQFKKVVVPLTKFFEHISSISYDAENMNAKMKIAEEFQEKLSAAVSEASGLELKSGDG